jgi:hypothetical protein
MERYYEARPIRPRPNDSFFEAECVLYVDEPSQVWAERITGSGWAVDGLPIGGDRRKHQ